MAVTVVDTSVLIAVIDTHDQHHETALAAVKDAHHTGSIVLPLVAFAETLVGPYRHSTAKGADIERRLVKLGAVRDADQVIGRTAAQLRATHNIKMPGALIIATGVEVAAQNVLTFDKRWATIDKRVSCLA